MPRVKGTKINRAILIRQLTGFVNAINEDDNYSFEEWERLDDLIMLLKRNVEKTKVKAPATEPHC